MSAFPFFLIVYGLLLMVLSAVYVIRNRGKLRCRLYTLLFFAAAATVAFYGAIGFGVLETPGALAATLSRLCVVILLSVLLAFTMTDL